MGIRKKRKLEEIQELQESNAVKKRVEHSLLEAQSSGADSNVFLLDDRSDTANATNVDTLEESDLTKTNYDVLDKMLSLLKLNLDLATWLKSYFFTSNYVLNRNESGRFGALKSDSTHHFFRNACTKSGSLRFSQFSAPPCPSCVALIR
jgi:hypothetical protein